MARTVAEAAQGSHDITENIASVARAAQDTAMGAQNSQRASHELAELAFQAERLYLGVAGGWQDQYATIFGGFNFMEFRMDQNIVHPLRIHHDVQLELEAYQQQKKSP